MSKDKAVADTDVIASKQDAAEAMEEPPARKEGFTRQHSNRSEQQASSGAALQDEDRLQEPGEGKGFSFVLADLNLQCTHFYWINYKSTCM